MKKTLPIVAIVAIVLAAAVTKLFAYKTLVSQSMVLHADSEKYYSYDMEITPNARLKIAVSARKDRSADLYIFDVEEYNYWAKKVDGKTRETREPEPLWRADDITDFQAKNLQVDYTGKVIFVVHNRRWNQIACNVVLKGKGL